MSTTFRRKIAYMVIALVLFGIIGFHDKTTGTGFGLRKVIGDIRQDPKNRLSEDVLATPGDVDSTSAVAVLVLGGLRGVATNLLWHQVHDLQVEARWTEFEPVVKSIKKLQPHFITVWTFQSWNLAYNVSVEWDAVEDKYYWIKQGIKFVEEGAIRNEYSPELKWDTGHYLMHKIGMADEKELLRKIYREDTEEEITPQGIIPAFNPTVRVGRNGRDEGQDNYETARDWFVRANQTLTDETARLKTRRDLGDMKLPRSEVSFRSYPASAQTYLAIARESEGQFGDAIKLDWTDAYKAWHDDFAPHDFIVNRDIRVRLQYTKDQYDGMYDAQHLRWKLEATLTAMSLKFKELNGELRKRLLTDIDKCVAHFKENVALLSDEQKKSIQDDIAIVLQDAVNFDSQITQPWIELLREPAEATLPEFRAGLKSLNGESEVWKDDATLRAWLSFARAADLLGRIADEELYWSRRYGAMVNYNYWTTRAFAEAKDDTIQAREHFYRALSLSDEGDPVKSRVEFENGFGLWQKVLDEFTVLMDDDTIQADTVDMVGAYLEVLDQLDLPRPEKIPFEAVVKKLTSTPEEEERLNRIRRYYSELQRKPQTTQPQEPPR